MEATMSVEYPPPLNHPEYYYSFVGVTLVWQILFFVISRKPVRLRPVMIFSLSPRGLVPQFWISIMIVDLAFSVLFIASYFKTNEPATSATVTAA
jgi:hypothetical protein